MCSPHAVQVWAEIQKLTVGKVRSLARKHLDEPTAVIETRAEARAQADSGHIYFVKVGNLIKVGWSSRLIDRLHAYGPEAEVLCHFPASRRAELAMHQNLRPWLARGREWYEDCAVIRRHIDDIVEQHGHPYIHPDWTQPTRDRVKSHQPVGARLVR